MLQIKQAKLTLEDGTIFTGKSFGSEKPAAGEVVFYTAMTGYPESLTDPSYSGQILVSTYPMVGNYGVPSRKAEKDIHRYFESHKLHIKGLIISDYSYEFSHWNAVSSLSDWLKEAQIPAIFDVDTRALTKILRDKGSMLGKIEFDNNSIDFYNPNLENLVAGVSCTEKRVYGDGDLKIVLIDCGVKNNIIKSLLKRGVTVIRVPWNYDFNNEEYDGLFISNGPGNPALCIDTITNIKRAMEKEKPIMGVCLGNQLLALAAGASTYKLKFGHRSHNQPVLLESSNSCYITAQNHGYAVDPKTLTDEWEPFFINLNDNSNEGIKHKTKPFFSTQFQPEETGGTTDTGFLFDQFIKQVAQYKEIHP